MVQLFIDGGGFMWPILGIGIMGLIFVGERLYHLISGLSANEAFAVEVCQIAEKDGFEEAMNRCEQAVGPVANLCYNALENASEGSEQAEKAVKSFLQSFFHSRIACDIKAKEGTIKRTVFPLPTMLSAIFKLVNVFPVPQAIIILPLSLFLNPVLTSLTALI